MYHKLKYFGVHWMLKCMSLVGVVVLFISSVILYSYLYENANRFSKNGEFGRRSWNDDLKAAASIEHYPKKSLIILAYWRGGSTFLGKIVDQHSDVFYFFEPLISHMKFPMNESMTLHYIDGTEKTYHSWQRNNIEKEILENILSCHLDRVSMEILTHSLIRLSKLSDPYLSCIRNDSSAKSVASCLPYLTSACKIASFTTMKVLRINMATIIDMLKGNDNLKVIHLVRDPRGIFSSRQRSEIDGVQYTAAKHVGELCSDMARNHFDAQMFSYQTPGRIKLVRYEDLARRPISVAEDIYNFIGLNFDYYVKDFIREITSYKSNHVPDPLNCYLCVVRKNSTRTAFKWRKYITEHKAREIDAYCKNVYSLFGYKQLNKTELRRAAFSSITDHF